MTTYAIGDIQGCYRELRALTDKINFDPALDQLWFVGDLVNRGPGSLETLRFIRSLQHSAVTVLGNHDLHLLAVSEGLRKPKKKDTLNPILEAPDAADLLNWLRHRPIMHYDAERNTAMAHAGIYPAWTLAEARNHARELELVLQSPAYHDFLIEMYGNSPDVWSDDLKGNDRLRFITNSFTRMRFVSDAGKLDLIHKSGLDHIPRAMTPWFRAANRRNQQTRIVFGHWAALGFHQENNVIALDTGCVWGGQMSAINLDGPEINPVQTDCAGELKPGFHPFK